MVKERLKLVGVLFLIFILGWCMVTTKMYETADRQQLLCVSRGGTWEKPEIRPWNLVEGTCHR